MEETHFQHFRGFSSACGNVVRLFEQLLNLFLFVQVANKLALQIILDIVDEEMHDRLRHAVLDVLADYQKIRLDQPLCRTSPDIVGESKMKTNINNLSTKKPKQSSQRADPHQVGMTDSLPDVGPLYPRSNINCMFSVHSLWLHLVIAIIP